MVQEFFIYVVNKLDVFLSTTVVGGLTLRAIILGCFIPIMAIKLIVAKGSKDE